MSKITSVEPQKKTLPAGKQVQKRFNIFLDGVFAFGADEDLVVDYRLIAGKVLEQVDIEKLLFEAEVGKLIERMYRLLSIRLRSEKEIRDYLKRLSYKRKTKGGDVISDLVAESLIEKINKKGLINDKQFAKDWVESRRRSKKKGRIALKQELFQKGISREIIEEVLEISEDEEKLAGQALEKKIRSWQNLSKMEFRKKAYEFLMRRGFEYEVIKNVVGKYWKKES